MTLSTPTKEVGMIVKKLHDAGVRSEHAYMAAAASIALSLATWSASTSRDDLERADRWRIFVEE
ncbi:hypothetical protein ADK93_10155 [Streptomyces sp. XY58]|nr:hypothetical protein ADK93_10155 [Streptomyces sp. XY58]KOV12708.1 hypothetical protein ADK89_00140 [Streptomyces sp. XY37]KOV56738.1 hypothetical protein ADK99_01930 [Streptomyces sp. MMG1064]